MKAYIEVYDGGKSVIKIEDDAGAVVDRYEVSEIRVEMSKSAIRPSVEIGQADRIRPPMILISWARN